MGKEADRLSGQGLRKGAGRSVQPGVIPQSARYNHICPEIGVVFAEKGILIENHLHVRPSCAIA